MVASVDEKTRSMCLINYATQIPSVMSNSDRLGKTWTYLFNVSLLSRKKFTCVDSEKDFKYEFTSSKQFGAVFV